MKIKKSQAEVIAYVLLILMAISVSVLVFVWLKNRVPSDNKNCPDGVSLIIKDYNYTCGNKNIDVLVQNKGRFTISGFILRANDRKEAETGFYTLDETGKELKPNEEYSYTYEIPTENSLTFLEVQPFIFDKEKIICADSVSSQALNC
jgi:hypothetical protein